MLDVDNPEDLLEKIRENLTRLNTSMPQLQMLPDINTPRVPLDHTLDNEHVDAFIQWPRDEDISNDHTMLDFC